MGDIKFEYGFNSVNGIVKKKYYLHEIPNIKEKCDLWNILPIAYVRQYTGLKDKNGVEIYEGDIVKTVFIKHNERNLELIQFIEFRDGCYFVKSNNADESDYEYTYKYIELCSVFSIEVIGNIHQNGELLK